MHTTGGIPSDFTPELTLEKDTTREKGSIHLYRKEVVGETYQRKMTTDISERRLSCHPKASYGNDYTQGSERLGFPPQKM